MTVTVLLFSSYADAFGAPAIQLELQANATVRDLLDSIGKLAAPRNLPAARVAINQIFAQPTDSVRAGDEIAVIPPVAGG